MAQSTRPSPVEAPQRAERYQFGTNTSGRAAVPRNAWEQFFFDFYFKAPEQSELQKSLQADADQRFKGLRTWKAAVAKLRAAGVRSLSPVDAAAATTPIAGFFSLFSPRALLVDVRESAAFERGHATGAVSVPLYESMVAPRDTFDVVRRVYFSLFGLRVPVRNEDFVASVTAAAGGDKRRPLILLCQQGGTLESAAERKARNPRLPAPIYGQYGAASRSLLAAAELVDAGFTRVSHLDGGFARWRSEGFPAEA